MGIDLSREFSDPHTNLSLLDQVLANSANHKADANKILVGGTSAGANLVLLAII